MSKKTLRERAFDLYKPPFKRWYGYVVDSDDNMVLDEGDSQEISSNLISRVRGWGRIQKLEDPEQLQDEVGDMIAEALNDFWAKHQDGSE